VSNVFPLVSYPNQTADYSEVTPFVTPWIRTGSPTDHRPKGDPRAIVCDLQGLFCRASHEIGFTPQAGDIICANRFCLIWSRSNATRVWRRTYAATAW